MLVACALLLIGLATLWPMPGASAISGLCLVCGSRGLADLLLNIILFMPLGMTLARRGHSPRRITTLALLLSTAIELSQFFIPGRDPSVSDVLANTCGAWLGALVFTSATTWLSPALLPTRASRLCRSVIVLVTLICLATGLLLTPAYPDSAYFGLWTPELSHFEQYRGRVLSASIDGQLIRDGPVHASDSVRMALQSPNGVALEIRVVAGPAPDGLAPLFAIFDEHRREILLAGVDHSDLVLRVHMRANEARLDRPELVQSTAWSRARVGDTMTISVAARGGHYAINGIDQGFSVGSGWGLLMYVRHLPFQGVVGAAWIAALFLPAGLWARTRIDATVIAVGVVVSLVLIPALTALLATPLLQWLGAGIGIGGGLAGQRALDARYRSAAPPHSD